MFLLFLRQREVRGVRDKRLDDLRQDQTEPIDPLGPLGPEEEENEIIGSYMSMGKDGSVTFEMKSKREIRGIIDNVRASRNEGSKDDVKEDDRRKDLPKLDYPKRDLPNKDPPNKDLPKKDPPKKSIKLEDFRKSVKLEDSDESDDEKEVSPEERREIDDLMIKFVRGLREFGTSPNPETRTVDMGGRDMEMVDVAKWVGGIENWTKLRKSWEKGDGSDMECGNWKKHMSRALESSTESERQELAAIGGKEGNGEFLEVLLASEVVPAVRRERSG